MKNLFCLKVVVLFIHSVSLAQTNEELIKDLQQVGLTFSTLGGAGIHYILPASDKNNYKFAGIFIYSNEESFKESYFSLGMEYQRDIVEDETKRAYFAVGGHIDNDLSEDLYFDANDYRESFFSLGAGLGIDFGEVLNGVIFNAHVTYQLTTGIAGTDRTRVGLGGGVGIGFNF